MAIENIWIIDGHSGICIYDWCHEPKLKTIDEQLVSGLLLAFKNFSSEAGLVDISAIEGLDRKLAYKSDDRFIIAAICHANDYEPLVDKTLIGILNDFKKKFKDIIEDGSSDVSPFRKFDEHMMDLLEDSTAPRTAISTFTGSIIAALTVGAIFVVYFFVTPRIIANMGSIGAIVGLIIILSGFIVAGYFGGLIAGDRRLGLVASLITVVPIIALFIAFFYKDWNAVGGTLTVIFYSLLYFLLFAIMALSGGLLGGYIKERRYLYPMTELLDNEKGE